MKTNCKYQTKTKVCFAVLLRSFKTAHDKAKITYPFFCTLSVNTDSFHDFIYNDKPNILAPHVFIYYHKPNVLTHYGSIYNCKLNISSLYDFVYNPEIIRSGSCCFLYNGKINTLTLYNFIYNHK